jgi:hypothetical protein
MKKDKKQQLKAVKQAVKDEVSAKLATLISSIVVEFGQDADKFKKIIKKESARLTKKLVKDMKFPKGERLVTVMLTPPPPIGVNDNQLTKGNKKSTEEKEVAPTTVDA